MCLPHASNGQHVSSSTTAPMGLRIAHASGAVDAALMLSAKCRLLLITASYSLLTSRDPELVSSNS
jgi:hypothetical protein